MNYFDRLILIPIVIFYFITIQSLFTSSYSNESPVKPTLIFISGWPQSGTSLIHNMMRVSPGISTMFEKCDKIHGEKCLNWNYEGQWLLESRSYAASVLKQGSMCPVNSFELLDENRARESFLVQWNIYWSNVSDIVNPIFCEKSPQSLLKIPLLYHLFKDYFDVKFLIVLKHPLTLNIATIRDFEWSKKRKNKHSSEYIPLTQEELNKNFDYFKIFMLHNNTKTRPCSLGWVPAMKQLLEQFNDFSHHLRNNVKIFRYEEFEQPILSCQRILKFVYNSTSSLQLVAEAMYKCLQFFPNTNTAVRSVSPRTINRISYSPKNEKIKVIPRRLGEIDNDTTRELRMKSGNSGSLQFSREVMKRSIQDRMNDFHVFYMKLTRNQKSELMAIDEDLKLFGYSMIWRNYDLYRRQVTRVTAYDLSNVK